MIGKRVIFSVLAMATLALAAAPSRMNVQVKTGQIRVKASFLGKVVANLPYGASLQVTQTKGDWMQVKSAQGQTGWMHKSALTTKRISLASGSATGKSGASSDELALAGKGFSAEVEKEYRQTNQKLNFAAVDQLEKQKVDPAEMEAFLAAGGLKAAEGAE